VLQLVFELESMFGLELAKALVWLMLSHLVWLMQLALHSRWQLP
jgi:hypothetical protein